MLLLALWPTDGFSRKGILLFLGVKTILISEIHNSESTFCLTQETECNVNGGWALAFLSEGKAILRRWNLNTFFYTWNLRGRTNTSRKLVMPHPLQAMLLGRNCLQRTPGASPSLVRDSEQNYGASKQVTGTPSAKKRSVCNFKFLSRDGPEFQNPGSYKASYNKGALFGSFLSLTCR